MAILEVHDIASGYEGVQILWGVNLKLEPGKLTTLVGSNGVGKTTLARLLAASAGAHFVEAMATASVPKLVLTLNHASGAGYYAMAGQGFDPDFILNPGFLPFEAPRSAGAGKK